MSKRVVAFVSILTMWFSTSISPVNANAAEKTDINRIFAQVPFIAWQEISKYKIASNINVNIKVHASSDFSETSKNHFLKGVRSTLNQFVGVFKPNDTIHVILATNYDDAYRFIKEINTLMPNYEAFNERHLSVAKDNFSRFQKSMGGTSSRNCFVKGGAYGDQGNQVVACPNLDGGVIYWWDATPEKFQLEEAVGSHEMAHIVLSKLNKMNHFRVPDWLIEGTMHSIGLSTVTSISNLKKEGTLFNPSPRWTPVEFGKNYDLAKMNHQNSSAGDDVFSIGTLAISLLISEVGAKKFFDFMKEVGYPMKWEDTFLTSFGFSADEFYKKFMDFHAWYYYENGYLIIQNTEYIKSAIPKTTITCVKGKTTKKVSGTTPKCPAGFKKVK